MAARLGLFLIVWLLTVPLGSEEHRRLVTWNVGQGQWVTLITERACWHFDAGGEKAPWKQIRAACRNKKNFLNLSHWDLDHVSFVTRLHRELPEICLFALPPGAAPARRDALLRNYALCHVPAPFQVWDQPAALTENDRSRVVLWNQILIPGDSTRAAEKIWVRELSGLARTHILILGHHGSQTSTSLRLLARLPSLQMAISSARKNKYGHPHARVANDLARARVALLRTEEWNSISIELD